MDINIIITLFVTFFKIGLFCFGGGYAMVGMIEREMVGLGYLTSSQYADIVAISQVTPGPLAINTATYVGATLGSSGPVSVLYSAAATIGVSAPSFILILLIAMFFKNFGKSEPVKRVMGGIRPSVIGLILGAAILFARFSIVNPELFLQGDIFGAISLWGLVIAAVVFVLNLKTKLNPIWLLLGAGVVGLFVF